LGLRQEVMKKGWRVNQEAIVQQSEYSSQYLGGSKTMAEITIKVPKNIKNVINETSEAIYVEALKEVAFKRMAYTQQQLNELRTKIDFYENKYGKSYEEFLKNVPNTMEGHDDWIDWTYLTKTADELFNKIQKFGLLIGK
jgi:thymidylate kinase